MSSEKWGEGGGERIWEEWRTPFADTRSPKNERVSEWAMPMTTSLLMSKLVATYYSFIPIVATCTMLLGLLIMILKLSILQSSMTKPLATTRRPRRLAVFVS